MSLLPLLVVFAAATMLPTSVVPQETDRVRYERRQRKIEAILRVQDSRSPVRSILQEALGDPDPSVREQATLACASLQDTSFLDLLVRGLTDQSLRVQEISAYAIGQTGRVLSEIGRKNLEYDLLWNRLRITTALPRLLEEIGKFGTTVGLEDMLVKLENESSSRLESALHMSLARFAIRGIFSDRSVKFLLRSAKPADRAPWQVVYALQRIGDHPEIVREYDGLLTLRLHPDPMARMYYAALLGKLSTHRDVRGPLSLMAEHDADWRVQVNALRALCSVRGFDPDVLRRSLYSQNQHIQVTALIGLGSALSLRTDSTAGAARLLEELSAISDNMSGSYPWQLQGEAAVARAKIQGDYSRIPSPLPLQPELRAFFLRAAAATGNPAAMQVIQAEILSRDSRVAVAALEGALALCRTHTNDSSLRTLTRSLTLAALRREDVALTATAASVSVDSLIISSAMVPALMETFKQQVPSEALEAMVALIDALGDSRDTRAVPLLLDQLRSREPVITEAAARALNRITGADYRGQIQFQGQLLNTNFDFARLWALPDSVPLTLETVRGTVVMELYPREAPFTVLNFLTLATGRKLYNGVPWHRVVSNFVVQGGDPRGDGWGGPGYTIRSEFPMRNYDTGSIGMASAGKDTEGSQFFITHSPQPHLDGRYTIFGRVVSGMDVVDRLQVGDTILDVVIPRGM